MRVKIDIRVGVVIKQPGQMYGSEPRTKYIQSCTYL